MSYMITISGHKETGSQEETKAFEEKIFAQAQEFVSSLEGVVNASFSGSSGQVGGSGLMEEAQTNG